MGAADARRYRARAKYRHDSGLTLNASWQRRERDNKDSGFASTSSNTGLRIGWTSDTLSVLLGASFVSLDSEIAQLVRGGFRTDLFQIDYEADADFVDASVRWLARHDLALSASYRDYANKGDADSGTPIDPDTLVAVPCEFWIPAARPNVIHEGNVNRMDTRVVAQGANIAVTGAAEDTLAERGVLVVPDFVANAGGVICASVEYRGGLQNQALSYIRERIAGNVRLILERSRAEGVTPRTTALAIAQSRVKRAMSWRQPG